MKISRRKLYEIICCAYPNTADAKDRKFLDEIGVAIESGEDIEIVANEVKNDK